MNLLIIVIMTLTFLNLVVITGILTGLILGSFEDNRLQQSGDILISPIIGENSLVDTHAIRETLRHHPEVKSFTERYIQPVTVEANYQTRWDFDSPENSVSSELTGIEPDQEAAVTNLPAFVVEGEYLNPNESGYVLIGSKNLEQYTDFSDTFDPLQNVTVGSLIKLSFAGEDVNDDVRNEGPDRGLLNESVDRSGTSAEFVVKGIVDSKVTEVSLRVFMTKDDWKRFTNQQVDQVDEFAVLLSDNRLSSLVVSDLKSYGLDKNAQVETAEEAVPSVLFDLAETFGLLGNAVGAVAVIVSSITVFVVIYINALTRRKQIGILKAIGINGRSIEIAYILQSLFYAAIGCSIGYLIIFFALVPYFDANPIDFPFSDGILAVTVDGTALRALILVLVTAFSGYLPSWLIVRQNTLDSILGR